VFIPSFFMVGAAQALFVPLSLSVGFAMITSYLLSSTFVPVMSVWVLRHYHADAHPRAGWFSFARFRAGFAWVLRMLMPARWAIVGVYFVAAGLLIWLVGGRLGTEIFPSVDTGQFQLRLRAADGTRIERTEELAKEALAVIGEEVGPTNVAIT